MVTCPYHFNLLSCNSLNISPIFVVSQNSYSVHLCNTTHPSQHPHFCDVPLIILCFLRCPCHSPKMIALLQRSCRPTHFPCAKLIIPTALYGLSPNPGRHPLPSSIILLLLFKSIHYVQFLSLQIYETLTLPNCRLSCEVDYASMSSFSVFRCSL